jgi:para-aminobenzoate synthetase component I
MLKIEIPYNADSTFYYERIRHLKWPVFLDSAFQKGREQNELARFDIITANPFTTLITDNSITTIDNNSIGVSTSQDNPLELLHQIMNNYKCDDTDLPFVGGALGYFSYSLGMKSEKSHMIPSMHFGIYDWALIIDHHHQKAFIASPLFQKQTEEMISEIRANLSAENNKKEDFFSIESDIAESTNLHSYTKQFNTVKDYLKQGDCYQVNISKKYQVKAKGESWCFYKKFREINQSPFMAYLCFDEFELLSGSPERFLKAVDGKVSTRPIKGTRARGVNQHEDREALNFLINSAKDKAENLMIVDLLRNDLGVSCDSGSINVDELFTIETYPNVHHLVSSVSGVLKKESNIYSLFENAFPGGSITGAPKKRAMEIIEELEEHARDFYCGSVAYFSFNERLDSNISIRSIISKEETLFFYSGGGLTIESNLEDEYQEIEDKVKNIKKTILFFKDNNEA